MDEIEPINDAPVLDSETLDTLQRALGAEFPALLTEFLDETPDKLQQIERALDAADLQAARRIAHVLKGTSGNLGVMNVCRICSAMEAAAFSGDQQQTRQQLTQAVAELEVARDALMPYLQGDAE